MTKKRNTIKNDLIQIVAKQLGNEYLNQLKEIRSSDDYKKLVTSGLKKMKKQAKRITSQKVNVTFKEYEEKIFENIILQYSSFLVKTKSHNPPENEVKELMRISFIRGNINEKIEKGIEEVNSEYLTQFCIAEAIKLI